MSYPTRNAGLHKIPKRFRNGIIIHQPRSLFQSVKKRTALIILIVLIVSILFLIWPELPVENDELVSDDETQVEKI